MIETVLTRIILRYAQRYICDTLRTDSLSLWGGDLRIQNFELRSEELSQALGTADSGLQLTRGFVRELRVVVPWNAIRSQSLRVEVDAVEIIFSSKEKRGSEPEPAPMPKKETSHESLEETSETSETWLQPLLRTIFGNIVVSVDNLVTKLLRNGAVACVTVERLDSRPQSPQWEACFTPLTGSQPTLYRVISIRDVTATLDQVEPRRVARKRRQVALPLLHRASAEVFVEWPLLPWPSVCASVPTGRLGLHVSPIRARLGSDQVKLLGQMAATEAGVRRTSRGSSGIPDEAAESFDDSESDRLSCGGSSRRGDARSSVSRQGTPLQLDTPRGDRPPSCPATPSKGVTPTKPVTPSTLQETPEAASPEPKGRGFGSFLADVLFGDDEDEEVEEEERDEGTGTRVGRETRRVVTFAACFPLLALSLEKASGSEETGPWNSGAALPETCRLCTLALVGLSAAGLSPAADSLEPFEGSLELPHVSIQLATAARADGLTWGTVLQNPFEVEEPASPAPAGARPSSKVTSSSLSRAASWIEAGQHLVGEFPPASHDVLGISGSLVTSNLRKDAQMPDVGPSAVRLGFLIVPQEVVEAKENECEETESEPTVVQGPSLWRVSVQLAQPRLDLELDPLLQLQELLEPLLRPSVGVEVPATPRETETALATATSQAVMCCSGVSVSLLGFELHVGPWRAEWREKRAVDEVRLASLLQESSVFISSAMPHFEDDAVAQLLVPAISLKSETEALMSLEKITVVSTLGATATHLEGHLERISLRLMEATLSQLMALASMESQGPLGGTSDAIQLEVRDVEVAGHWVTSKVDLDCSTPRPRYRTTSSSWSAKCESPPWATSDSEEPAVEWCEEARKGACGRAKLMPQGIELRCKQLKGSLLGRQHVNATMCSLLLSTETQVTVEVVSVHLLTGRIFEDIRSCTPQVSSPSEAPPSSQAQPESGAATRVRIGALDMTLQHSEGRHLAVKCQDAFVHVVTQRICFGTEALSMVLHNAAIATIPLLSPLQLEGQMVTIVSTAEVRPGRTQLSLHSSPVELTAGAWQLGLLIDVCSFRDPEDTTEEVQEERPKPEESSFERLLLELQVGESQVIADDALPLRWRGVCAKRMTVLKQSWEQMEVWQAVQLPEADGTYVLHLDGPARIADVYVLSQAKGRARRLQPEEYEVAAWDDAQGQFVVVRGEGALGYERGEAMLERMAQSSHLLRLSFRQSLQQNFLVELEAMRSSASELSVTMTTPRLTWSVCNSGVYLPPSRAAQCLEEMFGDISFLDVHVGVWQGCQGMAIGARAQAVGAELYDMSTLSLVPIVVPEENSINFAMRMAQVERPEHVALRTSYERRNTIDLNLGVWRLLTVPWAMARLVEMGSSLSRLGIEKNVEQNPRHPLQLRNGLPVPLVFGQPHAEATAQVFQLPSGACRSHAWDVHNSQKQLCFGKNKDSLSEPLSFETQTAAVRWAATKLPGLGKVCVCIRRISCAQLEIELLPPVLVRSDLCYDLDFQFYQLGTSPSVEPDEEKSPGSRCPECGSNKILDDLHFAKDLPLGERLRAERSSVQGELVRSVVETEMPQATREDFSASLSPGKLVGFQAPGRLQLRRADGDWSLELPLSHEPLPFTTMLNLDSQGDVVDTVLCTGHDLYGVPRDAEDHGAAADLPGDALPQILWLRPVMIFTNSTKWSVNLLAPPLHIVAGPEKRCASRGMLDPRQLRHLELQVLPDAESKDRFMFSSGPLLLSSLTQSSNCQSLDLVSYRNAVRCSQGEGMAYAELHLLLEIRRCRQSGLLREVIAEPMWQVKNETGCEILFGLARGEPSMPLAEQGHAILHRAECGESWTAALGAVQDDQSLPLNVSFGVADEDSVLWTAASCPVGQTTLVEVSEKVFRLLVSVDVRKPGESSSGGILVSLFAGAYLCNELPFPVQVQLGDEDGEICLPAAEVPDARPIPYPRTGFASLLEANDEEAGEGHQVTRQLRVKVQDGKWSDLVIEIPNPLEVSRSKSSGSVQAKVWPPLKALPELFLSEQRCSAALRDQTLELRDPKRASCSFNVALRLQSQALVLTLLPSEAPWVCSNLSCRTVWLSEAWIRQRQIQKWHRIAAQSSRELSCSFLRTLEVFPNAELSPRESREVVYARVSLDPEADENDEDAHWHIDVVLGTDSDRYWQPPVPRGLGQGAVPLLKVCVRCSGGVTLLEIRDEPSTEGVPQVLPKRSDSLQPSLDVSLQVQELALHAPCQSRALLLRGQGLVVGFRKEVEEADLGRSPTLRQLYHFQSSTLSLEEQVSPEHWREVLFVPPVSMDGCELQMPFASAAWELLKVDLQDTDAALRVCMDFGLLELLQALALDFQEEFAIQTASAASAASAASEKVKLSSEDFHYISLHEVSLPALPIIADLRLSSPVFVSFTGLSLTFPEIHLVNVTTTSTKLGQELIAHCIAFLLLNSPVLLGSCDLLGNPVQAYRHLRSGLGDFLKRPLKEGLGSLARHTASAPLLSLLGLFDSVRQNLPHVPVQSASSSGGLKALLGGFGRGLSKVVGWVSSESPDQQGARHEEPHASAGRRLA